jgi:peptide chain release factor 2
MWPTVFEVPKLESRIKNLELSLAHVTEWTTAVQAQQQELAQLQDEVAEVTKLQADVADLAAYVALGAEAKPGEVAEMERDATEQVQKLEQRLQVKEQELRFDGPHDRAAAIITIQAGAGGTDAQDWAEMLERMYLRFAEAHGWSSSMLTRSAGEEAGIKHTTFILDGKCAYGLLRGEHGVHRLVRQSPFNADSLRQTSFARVELLPKLSVEEVPEIDDKDLAIDTFRASGAGGQHVNKTSSAVRIRHVPTGIVVECQNERSQAQNKAQAMSVLQAKLQLLFEEQQAQKTKDLRGEIKAAAWGNQIRSYVLHPYRMVKDHRSNVETSDVEGVLNGDLSVFLNVL